MTQSGEGRFDDQLVGDPAGGGATDDDVLQGADEDTDAEELATDEAIDTADFEAAVEDFDDPDASFAEADEQLSQKQLHARSLAARRAIERRMEQKRLEEDLDYLDLDVDE